MDCATVLSVLERSDKREYRRRERRLDKWRRDLSKSCVETWRFTRRPLGIYWEFRKRGGAIRQSDVRPRQLRPFVHSHADVSTRRLLCSRRPFLGSCDRLHARVRLWSQWRERKSTARHGGDWIYLRQQYYGEEAVAHQPNNKRHSACWMAMATD